MTAAGAAERTEPGAAQAATRQEGASSHADDSAASSVQAGASVSSKEDASAATSSSRMNVAPFLPIIQRKAEAAGGTAPAASISSSDVSLSSSSNAIAAPAGSTLAGRRRARSSVSTVASTRSASTLQRLVITDISPALDAGAAAATSTTPSTPNTTASISFMGAKTPTSAVTPASAFSVGTFHAHPTPRTAGAAAAEAEEADGIVLPHSPTVEEMNAFGLRDHSPEDAISSVTGSGKGGKDEVPNGRSRSMSVSTQHSGKSLSIAVVPPPTSVLWSNSAQPYRAGEIYGGQSVPLQAQAQAEVAEQPETGRFGELKRFMLWETKTRFYLVGHNTSQTRFRILKIDRVPPIALSRGSQKKEGAEADKEAGAKEGHLAKPQDGPTDDKASEIDVGASRAAPGATAASDPSKVSSSGERYVDVNSADCAIPRKTQDSRPQAIVGSDAPGGNDAASIANGAHAASSTNASTLMGGKSKEAFAAEMKSMIQEKVSEQSKSHANRDADWQLNVTTDSVVYTRTQKDELFETLDEGNKNHGGVKVVGKFFGIVGFIRFTGTYYMVLISKSSVVALVGGHYVYHCDETKIVPVCDSAMMASIGGRSKAKDQEEARLLATFQQVDLSKNFYFSHTYDLTKTLQDNLTRKADVKSGDGEGDPRREPLTAWGFNEKFVWNHHLLMPAFGASVHQDVLLGEGTDGSEWVLPLVHGFVDQSKLVVLTRIVYVTLIARRSRHFAGARFLKRGITDKGQVANDVETEQIVNEPLTSAFYVPRRTANGKPTPADQSRDPSPRFTSYVMHRGSIPVHWTQDSTIMSPRPPIEISVVDPYFSAAALHFDDMLRRYGAPIIVTNLIKTGERQEREGKLGRAYSECIEYLNQFLPEDKQLRYWEYDMSRAQKAPGNRVIGGLENFARKTLELTKFFHTGVEPTGLDWRFSIDGGEEKRSTIQLQSGIARINCVDCLDRTNSAQSMLGKQAFAHQLYALGIIAEPTLHVECEAIRGFFEMYKDLGDTIALQYGGSQLVNTMETYQKINPWRSHSRDMLEGIKRYYSNSFIDAEKQAAINLFLGVDPEEPELTPAVRVNSPRYRKWYEESHLHPPMSLPERKQQLLRTVNADRGFWAEYYKPRLFTDLKRRHAYKMTILNTSLGHPALMAGMQGDGPRVFAKDAEKLVPSPLAPPYQAARRTSRRSSSISTASIGGESVSSQSSGALIGGVRRWMSINKAPPTPTKRKGSKLHRSHALGDVAEDGVDEKSAGKATDSSGLGAGSALVVSGMQTSGAFPALEVVLKRMQKPTISADEMSEYEGYTTQFTDVSLSQTHHIDEADMAMYEEGAALASGEAEKVEEMMMAVDKERGLGHSTADPVLLAYASAAPGSKTLVARLEKVSEAKVRAYSQWLQSHLPK